MPASFPASMVNQKRTDLGIPNQFSLISSRFSAADLTFAPVFPRISVANVKSETALEYLTG